MTGTVTLTPDARNGWAVAVDGEQLGLVYRLGASRKWKAKRRGCPAPVVTHRTRALAVVALYDATRATRPA